MPSRTLPLGARLTRLSYQRPRTSPGASQSRFPLVTLPHYCGLISLRVEHTSAGFPLRPRAGLVTRFRCCQVCTHYWGSRFVVAQPSPLGDAARIESKEEFHLQRYVAAAPARLGACGYVGLASLGEGRCLLPQMCLVSRGLGGPHDTDVVRAGQAQVTPAV